MGVIIDIGTMDLDNTIQLVPASGSDPEYYASDNGVVRSEFYELGNRVVFKRNGRSFSWTPDSMRYVDEDGLEDSIYTVQDVPLETKANYARFNRSFPDVDDWFLCHNDMLKHQILLQGFQRDPSPFLSGEIDFVFGGRIEFDSDLRVMANGLVLVGAFETGEGIDIIDLNGDVLFSLPQIVAYDSKIPDRAMTYGKYRVNSNDSGVLAFDIVVDNAWISSTDRVYPIVIDPTVVVALAYDTSGNGGRKHIGPLTNGWLITTAYGSTTHYFYKSADNGTTWSQLFTSTNANNIANGAALTFNGNIVTVLFAIGGGGRATTYTFDATTQTNVDINTSSGTVTILNTESNVINPSIVTNSLGVMTAAFATKNATYPNSFNIRSAKSTDGGVTWTKQDGTAGVDQITANNNVSVNGTINPCVVAKSNNYPTIIYEESGNGNYYLASFWWSGSAWSGESYPVGGTGYSQTNPCSIVKQYGSNVGRVWTLWDGIDSTDTTKRNVRANYSDSGGATWNTAFKLTTGNTIDRQKPTLSENTNGDIYVFYQDGTAISYQKCADGTTTFSGVTTFASAGTNPSAQERAANSMIGVVYMASSQVKFDKLSFNVAPNAPTLTTKANFDATASASFAWTFSDPDTGNTQSAYQLIIIKVSDSSTALDTGKVTSTTSSYTLTAATLDNAEQYQWKVRTYDQGDLVGPYSSLGSFYASAAPTTTITFPATDGDTITSTSLTATWSFSDPNTEGQSAYQVKLTDNSDVSLKDSGKVTDTVARALTIDYTLANSTDYKVKITTYNGKGIASAEAVRTFTTSFTVPETPTLALTAETGYILATVTNPTPTGSEPLISYNDIYRRVSGATAWVRIATSIADSGTYSDYAVASGVTYEYKVTAIGNNGTSADSSMESQSITLKCVYLFDVTDPAGTIRRYGLDGKGRSASYTPNVTMMQFAGRSRPVAEFGENAEGKISVQLDMLRDSGDMEALRALMLRNATVLYRDNRGRKMYGVITALPETDVPMLGYYTTLEIVETAQTEAV